MAHLFGCLLLASLAVINVSGYIDDGYRRYDDYTVLRFTPQNRDQLDFLQKLSTNESLLMEKKIDFWLSPTSVNSSVDVMMSPDARSDLMPLFSLKQLKPIVMIEDVQR